MFCGCVGDVCVVFLYVVVGVFVVFWYVLVFVLGLFGGCLGGVFEVF